MEPPEKTSDMLSDNHLRGHSLPNTWGISLGSFGTCINFMFFAKHEYEYIHTYKIMYMIMWMRKERSGEVDAINKSKRLKRA